MGIDEQTLSTYNNSANALAEYFRGIGPRKKYVDYALSLSGVEVPDVLELGCGDGRDAAYIVSKAGKYIGVDYSKGLLEIAQKNLPEVQFMQADMQTYEYETNAFDVVFAFASLLHIDKTSLRAVFREVHKTLRPSGIFYISTKYRANYEQEVKHDRYGQRLFYYYSEQDIAESSKGLFTIVTSELEDHGNTTWLEAALRKK